MSSVFIEIFDVYDLYAYTNALRNDLKNTFFAKKYYEYTKSPLFESNYRQDIKEFEIFCIIRKKNTKNQLETMKIKMFYYFLSGKRHHNLAFY